MDILLAGSDEGAHIRPLSIHGMLWLQTHFEDENWEALASSEVKISMNDAQDLSKDAKEAGLMLNFFPAVTVPGRF